MRRAIKALQNLGYDSVASFLDDLLKLDLVNNTDCSRMSIALLTHGEKYEYDLVWRETFRQLLCKYTSKVVDEELTALVETPALRLPTTAVSPEELERFNIKNIAQCHEQIAPFTTSVIRLMVGFDGNEHDEDNIGEEVELGDEAARQKKTLPPSRQTIDGHYISLHIKLRQKQAL